MAIQKIKIDPAGDRIQLNVIIDKAQTGFYTLRVWESGSNDKIFEREGNNLNLEDDKHDLPLPTSSNVGRVVDCIVTVGDQNHQPGGVYGIDIEVRQGAALIGTISDHNAMKESVMNRRLFAQLTV